MNYDGWLKTVPVEITGDALWQLEAYRLALFLTELGWHDATKLTQDKRTLGLSDQLYRAVGSIAANLSEGYSRGSGRDRARFYEYALGSARESRTWFYAAHHVLGENVVQHRIGMATQITRLLLVMIPNQRGTSLHEDSPPYYCNSAAPADPAHLENLLRVVPLPELTNDGSRITDHGSPLTSHAF